ncbi:MAG: hypothetical protein NW224_09340 [Leptolyngbyaceae cyanobacterium bins.302]|nr:hypothetical protein [Leptolyngbyaceae cyanobacterium bins.302]
MELFSRGSTNDCQWALYKQLELIPPRTAHPYDRTSPFSTMLNLAWRPFLTALLDELIDEQRVEYLERCWGLDVWALDDLSQSDRGSVNSLQRLWVLMN